MTTNPNLAEQVWQAMRGTTEHWGGCADRAAVERVLEVFAGWRPPVEGDVIERTIEVLLFDGTGRQLADEGDARGCALELAYAGLLHSKAETPPTAEFASFPWPPDDETVERVARAIETEIKRWPLTDTRDVYTGRVGTLGASMQDLARAALRAIGKAGTDA